MEQKCLFKLSDKSTQKLKYANYASGLVRRFVDEFICENTPYTKKSSKKDAKKSKLSGYKSIIREKDAKEKARLQRLLKDCSINSLACNVIGFKDFRIQL